MPFGNFDAEAVADVLIEIRVVESRAQVTPALSATGTVLVELSEELINRFAPDAPDDIKSGALVRMVGWLWFASPALNRDQDALNQSGAASLLSRFARRRAAIVG